MPKSKQQKHQEAIDRLRKHFPKYRGMLLRYMPGGEVTLTRQTS